MIQKSKTFVFDVDDTMLCYVGGLRDYTNRYYGFSIEGEPEHYSLDGWIPGNEILRRKILEQFNISWEFGCLAHLPGAVSGIEKIVEYNKTAKSPIGIIALTKCGRDPITVALRKANLMHVFGPVFDDIIIIDGDESKKHYIRDIKRYRDIVLSVDDYVANVIDMDHCNVPTVIFRSSSNIDVALRHPHLPVAEDWDDLYINHIKPLLI